MSLVSAISYSLTGMRAIQADMQVISSNITNAQRDNFTRKNIILGANTITAEGTGGVSVLGYGRATSDNLARLLNSSMSDAGLTGTQEEYLNRIQTLFGSAQDTPVLTAVMNDFAQAWREFSAAPEDTTRRQNVIFKGQNLAREVRHLADGIDKVEADIRTDMDTAVDTLNDSLARIKQLNDEIVTASTSGQSAVDLMDLRDTEIRKLSELTKINIIPRDQGRISIYTPQGYVLLDSTPSQFTWDGSTISQGASDVTALFKGGKIEALVGLLDQGTTPAMLADPGKATIYKIEQQLDEIVDLFSNALGTFATAYNSAATGAGELASAFFNAASTRYNFDVAAALVNGTSTLKQAAASVVADDMDLTNRTVNVAGLSVTNVGYTGITDAIIYTHSQNTRQVSDTAAIYTAQRDDYKKRLQNETGVNVDEEVVRLTQLQNNYAATARVISTVQQMFDIIDRLF